MNETLTARLVENTFALLAETFPEALGALDRALGVSIQLVIGLLFVIPLMSYGLRLWARRSGHRRSVQLCGSCREELPERCARCPGCARVFPSSFLRSLVVLAVLALAFWTSEQRGQPAVFVALLVGYATILGFVLACRMSSRVRESRVARLGEAGIRGMVSASVRGRELWARGEAVTRLALVLAYYASLLAGLQSQGVPASPDQLGFGPVFDKLCFLQLLLAFCSLSVFIARVQRFEGLATLVLAGSSLLFFIGGAIIAHSLAAVAAPAVLTAPAHRALSAERDAGGVVTLSYLDAEGRPRTERLELAGDRLELSVSILVIERFGYARFVLRSVGGEAGSRGPSARFAELGWLGVLRDPGRLGEKLFALTDTSDPPSWLSELGAEIDPNGPRSPHLRLARGERLELFLVGDAMYWRSTDDGPLKQIR